MIERPVVEATDLVRSYTAGGRPVVAVSGVSMTVDSGEVVAVMGPSGSGKSTLLYLLAGLDAPDSGTARVTGVDWQTLEGSERARFRRRACGFIVQGLALLSPATAAENVEVPLLLDGVDLDKRQRRVAEALERVALRDHAAKLPDELSGGEQQRVAIARALAAEPAVVFADEPTGNLDSETGQAVTRTLVEAASEHGTALVLVTHDPAVAAHAQRIVSMRSGRIEAEQVVYQAEPA